MAATTVLDAQFAERISMIKSRGVKNGRPYIWLGLEEENIKRLKQGKPIFFDMGEIGIENFDMLISYGKNQQAIMQDMGIVGVHPHPPKTNSNTGEKPNE